MQRLAPRSRSQLFLLSKIWREIPHPNLQRFLWRRHAGGVILFLIHELFRQPNSHRLVTLLTNMTAFSAALQMRRHAKAQNSSVNFHKTQDPFRAKICVNSDFRLLLYKHESKISGGSIILQFEFQRRHVKPPNFSEKLRAKFLAATRGYSVAKFARLDDAFYEFFLNGKQDQSITAAEI